MKPLLLGALIAIAGITIILVASRLLDRREWRPCADDKEAGQAWVNGAVRQGPNGETLCPKAN